MLNNLVWIAMLSFVFSTDANLKIDVKAHEVQPGESLSQISDDYGVDWSDSYAMNSGKIGNNPDIIHPDTTLYIPLNSSIEVNQAVQASYKVEIWIFLLLLVLFMYIIYNKKINITASAGGTSKEIIREVVKGSSGSWVSDEIHIGTEEVKMDIKHNYIVPDADGSSEIKPDVTEGKVKTQVDKLKKIRKK